MNWKIFFSDTSEIYTPDQWPLIFLAWPAKDAPLWQKEAAWMIQSQAPDIHIATPRHFDQWIGVNDHSLEKQATWEQVHLEYARKTGAIIFACPNPVQATPGRDYARTTRNEMGVFQERCNVNGDKLFTWIEKEFQGEKYLRMVHENFYQTRNVQGEIIAGVVHVDSLQELCTEAIKYILSRSK